jgi:D-glycero-D-manno-heptose 1,7-bisphosphate phosphatase
MKNKAVFLDRDGTINIDYGYVYKPENFEFIDGAIEALKILQTSGYKLIIITNQSGISRGYYKEQDFLALHNYIKKVLAQHDVKIEGLYFCPHLNDNCDCRKPKTAMFYLAAKQHQIDFSKSYAIGDNLRDLSICDVEPVKGILLSDNQKGNIKNIIYCKNLLAAAKYISS